METEYGTLTDTELMEAVYDALVAHGLLDELEDIDCPEGIAILKAAVAEIGQRITIHPMDTDSGDSVDFSHPPKVNFSHVPTGEAD